MINFSLAKNNRNKGSVKRQNVSTFFAQNESTNDSDDIQFHHGKALVKQTEHIDDRSHQVPVFSIPSTNDSSEIPITNGVGPSQPPLITPIYSQGMAPLVPVNFDSVTSSGNIQPSEYAFSLEPHLVNSQVPNTYFEHEPIELNNIYLVKTDIMFDIILNIVDKIQIIDYPKILSNFKSPCFDYWTSLDYTFNNIEEIYDFIMAIKFILILKISFGPQTLSNSSELKRRIINVLLSKIFYKNFPFISGIDKEGLDSMNFSYEYLIGKISDSVDDCHHVIKCQVENEVHSFKLVRHCPIVLLSRVLTAPADRMTRAKMHLYSLIDCDLLHYIQYDQKQGSLKNSDNDSMDDTIDTHNLFHNYYMFYYTNMFTDDILFQTESEFIQNFSRLIHEYFTSIKIEAVKISSITAVVYDNMVLKDHLYQWLENRIKYMINCGRRFNPLETGNHIEQSDTQVKDLTDFDIRSLYSLDTAVGLKSCDIIPDSKSHDEVLERTTSCVSSGHGRVNGESTLFSLVRNTFQIRYLLCPQMLISSIIFNVYQFSMSNQDNGIFSFMLKTLYLLFDLFHTAIYASVDGSAYHTTHVEEEEGYHEEPHSHQRIYLEMINNILYVYPPLIKYFYTTFEEKQLYKHDSLHNTIDVYRFFTTIEADKLSTLAFGFFKIFSEHLRVVGGLDDKLCDVIYTLIHPIRIRCIDQNNDAQKIHFYSKLRTIPPDLSHSEFVNEHLSKIAV